MTKKSKVGLLALLLSASLINNIDRASLSMAAPLILKEFKMNPAMLGIALSVFFWPYFILQIPTGAWADKFGAKRVLGWSAAVWSLASTATGLVQGMYTLMCARLFVGVGEAGTYPCLTKVVGDRFPTNERGLAITGYTAMSRLGMAVTPGLMALLISLWGWRTAFIITGLGSLTWCVFWYYGFNDAPRQNARPGEPLATMTIPWRRLLSHRGTVGLVLVKFCQDYLMYFSFTWLPAYLVMGRGFSIMKMGVYASLPWMAGFITQPLAGAFSDYLIRKGVSVTKARKRPLFAFQLGAATIMTVGFINDPIIAVYVLTFAIAAESGAAGLLYTCVPELAPKNMTGSVAGIMNAGGAFAGSIAPIVTGFIVKFTGSFKIALAVGGISLLLAACFLLFVIPELKPMEVTDSQQAGSQVAGSST
jgi:ACS family glucarate transporter-like MFS transporter